MAKILLDQSAPVGVSVMMVDHDVTTAYRQGWDTLANGEPLAAAEAAGFEVFVTSDRRILYQQNLAGRKISLVVQGTNSWPVIREHAALVVGAVNRAMTGSFEEVGFPRPPLRRRPVPAL